MNFKKILTGTMLSVMAVASIGSGVAGAYHAFTTPEVKSVVAQVSSIAGQTVKEAIGMPQADALLVQSGSVTIESTDLTNVETSVGNLLKTVFEVLKLLPQMALIIGGFYLLDALISILPHPGAKRGA